MLLGVKNLVCYLIYNDIIQLFYFKDIETYDKNVPNSAPNSAMDNKPTLKDEDLGEAVINIFCMHKVITLISIFILYISVHCLKELSRRSWWSLLLLVHLKKVSVILK